MTADPEIQESNAPNSHFGRKCQVSTEGECYDASVRKTFSLKEIKMFTHRFFTLFLASIIGTILVACAAPATSLPISTDTALPDGQTSTAATSAPTSVKPFPHMPLPQGTYTSAVFETPLTYNVPTGWKMFEDEPGQFGLALLENDGPCLCIWRYVRAAATSCAEEPEPTIGSSASDIAGWLSMHEGL